jgi:hypothetical protein
MTTHTSLAVVDVAPDFSMMTVRSRLFMGVAIDAGELVEVAAAVAVGTIEGVGPPEREAMVERGLVPGSMVREVAVLAGGRETRRGMPRTPRVAIVIGVTAVAIGGQVVPLAVACLTIERPMGPLQRKNPIVIERRAFPTISGNAVASLAIGSEAGLLVIGTLGAIVVVPVAGDAVRGSASKSVIGVTLRARGRPMLAKKGKGPIVVE